MSVRTAFAARLHALADRLVGASQAPQPIAPAVTAAGAAPSPMGTQGTTSRLEIARPQRLGTTAAGLTPETVTSVIAAAAEGRPQAMMALLEDVETRDAHLSGVLGVRRRALLSVPWHLQPASESPVDRVRATVLERLVRRCENLPGALYDLTAAILQGYQPAEIQWRRTSSGLVYPARIDYRPARWFVPDRDRPEVLRLLDEQDLLEGVPLWADKWIVHHARSHTRFPAMAGLGPAVLWLYLFRRLPLVDWLGYAEKYGTPLRIGKYPRGTPDTEITKLATMLQTLGVDAWAAVPSDFELDLVADSGAKTGPDVFERLIVHLDTQLSKLILGQTLTTEAGPVGSLALGQVHNDVRTDIRDGDATELAATLTRDLIAPMYRFNFGDGAAPVWTPHLTPPEDRKALAEVRTARAQLFQAARALGVRLSESQVREDLGLAAPEDASDELVPASGSPLVVAPLTGRAIFHDFRSFALAAPAQAARLDAVISMSAEDMKRLWRQVMDTLRAELGGQADVETIRARMPAALAAVDLRPYADRLAETTLRAEALGRWSMLPTTQRDATPIPATSPLGDPEAWGRALRITPEAWTATAARHQARATETARYAMLRAAQEVLADLERAAESGTPSAEQVDAATARQADSPQRTSSVVEAAAGDAHGRGQLEAVAGDKTLFLRYHTMEDDLVRPTHRAMNGYVARADDPIWQTWRPPNGYGCRCYLTVHTADEVRRAGWKVGGPLPTHKGDTATPDPGWSVDTRSYDWTTFPPEWRAELDKAGVARKDTP